MDIPFLWSYSAVGAVVAVLVWSAFHPPRSRLKYIIHALIAVIVIISGIFTLAYLEKPKWERHQAPCAVNLSQIQAAKAEWAREFKKSGPAGPQEADLFGEDKIIRERLSCPEGGAYRLGAINELATCTLVGWRHELNRKPSHYQGSVTAQKAVFCLFGLGLVIVLGLLCAAWQVKGWGQKLRLGGLAAVLFVFISLGPPNFIQARLSSSKSACSAHLRSIQQAKETWAKELNKTPMDVPLLSDLVGPDKYLRDKPVCPLDGTYRLGAVREKPTCSFGNSYPGHTFEFNQ